MKAAGRKDLRAWPIETKAEIVAAYYAAKNSEERRAVLERHDLRRQSIYAFRMALAKLEGKGPARKSGRPRKEERSNFIEMSAEERLPLIAEYASLPHGSKGEWLDARGMNNRNDAGLMSYHARMYIKKNGKPRRNKKPNGSLTAGLVTHELIPASDGQPPVTLDDGINALCVQRDHLNETIRVLQALKQGVLASRR